MSVLKRIQRIDRNQRLRYALMVLGILALAPPVGFQDNDLVKMTPMLRQYSA